MEPLQELAYLIFKRIREAGAFSTKRMHRIPGVEGGSVHVLQTPDGPVYEEQMEGVTLRVWASHDGPMDLFPYLTVGGFLWARISTEDADRCIGVFLVMAGSTEWFAAREGDLNHATGALTGMRPGVDQFLEVLRKFEITAFARFAGREIDKHLGGDHK